MLLRGSDMARQKTAFTLVEVILVVLFLGIVAVIAIPRISYSGSSRQKADGVARKIITDLRRTRMLAISNAATNTTGFTLKMTGSAPYSGYQIVDDSNGTVVDSQTIDSRVSCICLATTQFGFGPLGNKRTGGPFIRVSAQGRTYTITFTNATGMVRCTKSG
jgi:type II secretory pathway pseudopilin PulG